MTGETIKYKCPILGRYNSDPMDVLVRVDEGSPNNLTGVVCPHYNAESKKCMIMKNYQHLKGKESMGTSSLDCLVSQGFKETKK
jgi:hypothetical protein